MEGTFVAFRFQTIESRPGIQILKRRQIAHLPAKREFNGYVIYLVRWIVEVDWVNSIGVLENMLFRAPEEPHWQKRSSSSPRRPSGNFHIVLCDERLCGSSPIRFIGQIHLNAYRDIFPNLILEKFFSVRVVLVSFLKPPPHRFQSRKGDRQFAFE